MDPDIWVSYKVTFGRRCGEKTSAYICHQLSQPSFADAEKTYSGLTDGCAKAGKAGCKLIEITGDGATGDDVKTLIDTSHDVPNFLLSRWSH